MSELTTYQARTADLADYQGRAVARLAEWAASAEAAYGVAERLVQTSFCPVAFRGKPMEATAAILAGAEVGLSPMSALKAFDVIQGQAAPRAITLRAIVQSYGHDVVLVESTSTRCRMKGLRRGSSEWQQVTWTIDRARDLGLTSKDGWKKQPAAMLVARATSELCRLVAADAILGIGYTAEEVADGAGPAAEVVEVSADVEPTSGARKMSRPRRAAPVAEEPPLDDPAPEPTNPLPMTSKSRAHMFALFSGRGIADREQQIAGIARVIGRTVESRGDLTEDEAQAVIGALEVTA